MIIEILPPIIKNYIPSYQSDYSENYEASFVTDDYFWMTSPQNTTYIYAILPRYSSRKIAQKYCKKQKFSR